MDGANEEFVPLTPNSLLYGRNLQTFAHDVADIDFNDPDFILNNKSLNVMARKLRATLAHVRKVWVNEYLHFLACKDGTRQKMAPATKSILIPTIGDSVLIKDGKDLRLGRVAELFPSEDGEVRSARILTRNGEGLFPVCNLRFLERGSVESPAVPVCSEPPPRVRVQRAAAKRAQEKMMSIHLLAVT